jgi:hypothetical protein
MKRLWVIAWIVVGLGCNRAQTASTATQPSTNAQPSAVTIEPATAPATEPVARAPSVILIDQKPASFPPALLQIRDRDGQLTAILMSDDPKDAINEDYHGNSFYIEMPLEVTDVKDLPNFVYRYSSPSSEKTDSPNGIFLDGNRLQLQPSSMQARFSGDDSSMTVVLSGQFLQFPTREETTEVKHVAVVGQLQAVVKQK